MESDSARVNRFGQPIGPELPGWQPRERPQRVTLTGRHARLEPLDPAHHGDALATAFATDDGRMWTYLGAGPFADRGALDTFLTEQAGHDDPLHFAILDATTHQAAGTLALMRQDPAAGVIEIGWVTLSPGLQRTTAATEAFFLALTYVFDALGYRRCEWKCDALNAPSQEAARRLGFTFEGTFRQDRIYKGRSRDTAWLSVTDAEWPAIRDGFTSWLDPSNFDESGRQRRTLAACRTN